MLGAWTAEDWLQPSVADLGAGFPPEFREPCSTSAVPFAVMAMNLRLSEEDERALRAIQAAEGGVSKHQAVLLAIRREAERTQRHAEVRGYTRELKERYGDVLDRLAAT